MSTKIKPRNWLRTFLNHLWLRPENAIWRSLNCQSLENISFDRPSIDISCGDGLFTFLLAGGEFDTSFDKFQGTSYLDEYYDGKDIYDAVPDEYSPEIKKRPNFSIDVGTDWKKSQLKKAEKLDFYDEHIQHNNNEPLPFETNRFKTVFTNSAYWVDDLDQHFEEIFRILQDNGQGIFVLKTPATHNLITNMEEKNISSELVDILDRGRRDSYKHLHDAEGWTKRLNQAGLDVIDRRATVSGWHAAMWNIGLRPIAPQLIKMVQTLPPEARNEIKSEWVDVWENLLEPFNTPSFDLGQSMSTAEYIFITSPKG